MSALLLSVVLAGCWNDQALVLYGFEAERKSWWAQQSKVDQRKALTAAGLWPDDPDAYVFSQVQKLDQGFVAVHPHCETKSRCAVRVTLLDAELKPTGRFLDLDPGPDAEVSGTALDDFDADGDLELVVRQHGRARRNKKRKVTFGFMHVVELPSLERSLRVELGWDTSVEGEASCETLVARGDDRCEGHPSVEAEQTCGPKAKVWRWDFDAKRGRFVDDRRVWAVIAGEVKSLDDEEARNPLIDDKLEAVRQAGFPHAVVGDTRTFAKLKGRFDLVVVGRLETKADADALAEAVRAKGLDASVRQVF